MIKRIFLTFLCIPVILPIASPCAVFAIGLPEVIKAANWELAAKWYPEKVEQRLMSLRVKPHWISGSDRFWYKYKTSEGVHYWLVDPVKKIKRPLFDRFKLASELTRHTGRPYNGRGLDIQLLSIEKGDGSIRFGIDGEWFEFTPKTGNLKTFEPKPALAREWWQNISPDKSLCVFKQGRSLFLMNLHDPNQKERQITTGGEKGFNWGANYSTLDEKDNQERRFVSVNWSPDSKKFCVYRVDLREVKDLWLIDHLSEPRPALRTFKYPMPGENIQRWELWVYNCETDKMIRIETDRWKSQSLGDFFTNTLWWSNDSKSLFFARRSRDFCSVDVCSANPDTGKSQILIEERLKGMIHVKPVIKLPGTDEFIWWSMRDGWGHLYLYGNTGNLKKQITRGHINVKRVVNIDKETGMMYVMVNNHNEKQNPYYKHLYGVSLDDSSLRLLTPEDSDHDCVFSPSRKYFIDNHSRVDLSPRSVLRDNTGNLVLELEQADISLLLEAGWKSPDIFCVKSSDGITDLWGVMYKPFNFDPNKKYPIVTGVYPGRHSEMVPTEFSPVNSDITLAQLGFIVVRFGNRGGCIDRGLWYRQYGRDDFRDYGLDDKKTVIEKLASRYPYICDNRVGIFGSSSGGFMTTSAMLVYPDFFKVGVAMAAPNDPSIYYNVWTERYHDVKQITLPDNTVQWETNVESNIGIAGNLKGNLLLIHGSQDGNVHPAHIFRMSQALVKANKHFNMFIVPDATHNLPKNPYVQRLLWSYFAEHLLGDRRGDVKLFGEPPQ